MEKQTGVKWKFAVTNFYNKNLLPFLFKNDSSFGAIWIPLKNRQHLIIPITSYEGLTYLIIVAYATGSASYTPDTTFDCNSSNCIFISYYTFDPSNLQKVCANVMVPFKS